MRLQLAASGPGPAIGLLLLTTTLTVVRPAGAQSLTEHVATEYGQYADTDHVFVETPSIAGAVANPTAGWRVGGHYLVDVVSAASVDIVSTASRAWHEVRQEGSVEASYEPKTFGVQAHAAVSDEPDYLSLSSAGAAVTQDLLDKNLTWLSVYSYGHDVAGRTGTPFSVFSHVIDRHALSGMLTFVMSPTTVGSLIGDAIFEDGDQSKPYRYIPLFAPGTLVPRGASIDSVNSLRASVIDPSSSCRSRRQRDGLTRPRP